MTSKPYPFTAVLRMNCACGGTREEHVAGETIEEFRDRLCEALRFWRKSHSDPDCAPCLPREAAAARKRGPRP